MDSEWFAGTATYGRDARFFIINKYKAQISRGRIKKLEQERQSREST